MEAQKEIVDVILFHNGADKDWGRKLGEQIESETFDGKATGRHPRVFDEWDIDVRQNVPSAEPGAQGLSLRRRRHIVGNACRTVACA